MCLDFPFAEKTQMMGNDYSLRFKDAMLNRYDHSQAHQASY
ncbi:hypothetical protein SAMN06295945_0916 [Polynucleobacter meluiroseus]|uniref:Uncharacterized protein n=1 Tax=Polynucleobacter meluiroseus TaxID=1938814 RepID=A0A240E102_9BURK|nr:hypothetical protein SAMN06295945_0916 [Polynucleobacter meluiroseus]